MPYTDESGQGWNEDPYPHKFVAKLDKCPSCDGDGAILCYDADDETGECGEHTETCDYCHGYGELDCNCENTAEFSTEQGFFCRDCLDNEHIRAFRIMNPTFNFEEVD